MDKNEVILIVDDIQENRKVLGDMLGNADYEVLVAADGPGALDIAGKNPSPDLILLDIRMPGMDGYDVCRRLKNDPATSAIPVIFLSALQEPVDKVTAFQAGVDYISKPFRIERFWPGSGPTWNFKAGGGLSNKPTPTCVTLKMEEF